MALAKSLSHITEEAELVSILTDNFASGADESKLVSILTKNVVSGKK